MFTITIGTQRVSVNPPSGSVMAYLGTTDPDGWVIADGISRPISSGIYANLIQNGIGSGGYAYNFNYRYLKVTFTSKFATNTSNTLVLGRMFFFGSSDVSTIYSPTVISGTTTTDGGIPGTSPGSYSAEQGFANNVAALASPVQPIYGVVGDVPTLINPAQSVARWNASGTGPYAINVVLDFGSVVPIKGYALFSHTTGTFAEFGYQSNPKSWSVSGSNTNNGTDWVVIDAPTLSATPISDDSLMYWTSPLYSTNSFYKKMTTVADASGYYPPNFSGAFLRGIGASGLYSGPLLGSSQNHATQIHSHGITDNGHGHGVNNYVQGSGSDPVRLIAVTATSNAGQLPVTSLIGNTTGITVNDSSTTAVNSINRYADANETRPYNYGVNWIIKL
jgi:hypothetical protein